MSFQKTERDNFYGLETGMELREKANGATRVVGTIQSLTWDHTFRHGQVELEVKGNVLMLNHLAGEMVEFFVVDQKRREVFVLDGRIDTAEFQTGPAEGEFNGQLTLLVTVRRMSEFEFFFDDNYQLRVFRDEEEVRALSQDRVKRVQAQDLPDQPNFYRKNLETTPETVAKKVSDQFYDHFLRRIIEGGNYTATVKEKQDDMTPEMLTAAMQALGYPLPMPVERDTTSCSRAPVFSSPNLLRQAAQFPNQLGLRSHFNEDQE